MKQVLIVANWKMNLDVGQSLALVRQLTKQVLPHRHLTVVLAPALLSLQAVSQELDRRRFRLAAQNVSQATTGSWTGETSLTMLEKLVDFVLVGHPDRRFKLKEDDQLIGQKVAAVIHHGLTPIVCVGETALQRSQNQLASVLADQVRLALYGLTGPGGRLGGDCLRAGLGFE